MREQPLGKHALDREMVSVEVDGQPIAVKLARHDGVLVNAQPEYDDVARAAARPRPAGQRRARRRDRGQPGVCCRRRLRTRTDMDLVVIALTFGAIFVVELPDKTFIATLVLQHEVPAAAGLDRRRPRVRRADR